MRLLALLFALKCVTASEPLLRTESPDDGLENIFDEFVPEPAELNDDNIEQLLNFDSPLQSITAETIQNITTPVISRVAPGNCKAHPSGSWPSMQEWLKLNTMVESRLLQPPPAASACHRDHPNYNAQRCNYAKEHWVSSEFHSHHPTSSLWTNVNGYSCEVMNVKAPCTTNGFPAFVLNATSAKQIATAVKWAKERNVRVSVKSTGHDFLGRSTQPYSLSIWVHYLQQRQYHAGAFQPKGCAFTIPGPAVTAGGGTQMRKLTNFVKQFGQNVVVGNSLTVSVGGYVSGGGHSIYSGLYGLAADQVLELEMVTPSGDIVIANECQNPDLFWAVRGGGGGTFGVMSKVTMKTFPATGMASWQGSIHGPAGGNATWDAITAFHGAWARYLAPAGVTGYAYGNIWKTGKAKVSIYYPSARSEAALTNILSKVIRDTNSAGKGKATMTGVGRYKAASAASRGANVANDPPNMSATSERTFPGNGQNKIIASWLWGAKELAHPKLKQALMAASDNEAMLYQDFTAGIGVHKPPFLRGGGNAVGPGWRSALVRPAAELQWAGDDVAKLARRKKASLQFTASMAQLNPNMGMYVNEADPDTANAQQFFWGANYPKLLQIKKKYDPTSVFWCKPCVGGEEWIQSTNGLLCKK